MREIQQPSSATFTSSEKTKTQLSLDFFLIGFEFQFWAFFLQTPPSPTKIGQEIIDSKVMGKLQKITQQRKLFQKIQIFLAGKKSFKFPSLNFIMSGGW